MLAGIIARPRATSSRTNSGVTNFGIACSETIRLCADDRANCGHWFVRWQEFQTRFAVRDFPESQYIPSPA